MPWPVPVPGLLGGSVPAPSSRTTTSTRPSWWFTWTVAADACACRTTLVRASRVMRYTALPVWRGIACRSSGSVSSTARPVERTVSTSSGRSASPGIGWYAGSSSRSALTTARTSSRELRLTRAMLSSASAAFSGSDAIRWRPTPAWTAMVPREWPMMSCSSRAIRSRSSVDLRLAASSAAWALASARSTRSRPVRPRARMMASASTDWSASFGPYGAPTEVHQSRPKQPSATALQATTSRIGRATATK